MALGPKDQANAGVAEAESQPSQKGPGKAAGPGIDLEALADLSPQASAQPTPSIPMLRTARLVDLAGSVAKVQFRGATETTVAAVDDGVDLAFLAKIAETANLCLCEWAPGVPPVVVGIVQRTSASGDGQHVDLKAESLTLEAEREITLRAGRAGIKLRQDGSIEIVGSRISAVSRGLFRLVGRMLRLN